MKGLTPSHGRDQCTPINFWTRGRVVVEGCVPRAHVVLLQIFLHSLQDDRCARFGRGRYRAATRSHGDPARAAPPQERVVVEGFPVVGVADRVWPQRKRF